MTDPDFDGLRSDVETATRLPEFDRVAKRARKVRRRDLRRRLVISLTVIAALVPVGVAGWNATPRAPAVQGRDPIGPDRPEPTPSPTPSTAPVATIRAIAGAKIGALYAAIDVCRPAERQNTCSLQVVPLGATAQEQRGPIAVGELRDDPTDSLEEVSLQSVTPHALLLSGIRRDGERKYRRINLRGGGAEIAPEPSTHSVPMPGDQAVQLTRYGTLNFIRQADARVLATPTQPNLEDPVLVTSVGSDDGWWATGIDPITDEIAVAVSHDLGVNWVVTPIGLKSAMSDPILATADGDTAYLFVRTAGGIQQRLTTDGGLTWRTVTTVMPWPSFGNGDVVDRKLGAVVRGDGSLLVWVEATPGAVFLESTDLGSSYRAVNGPSGPIVALQDGFVAVGDPPLVSIDGHTWAALPRPAVVSPT